MKKMSFKRAAMLNAGTRYFVILFNLAFSAIMSRILTPEDYGIVAVTTVFTTFFFLLADMGIGTGVIQNKTLSVKETNDIYSISVYLSIFLGIAFTLFSISLAWFYQNSAYKLIGIILGISLFFSALNMVPNALLMKDKRFVIVSVRNVIVPLVANIVGILLAFLGFRYYALVLQSLLSSSLIVGWNLVTTRRLYGLKFQKKINSDGLRKIRSFSGFLFSFNIINYFARNLDNLLISKVIGETSLAFYNKAYNLMLYPVQNLTYVITPVMHPILSNYQKNKMYIYTQYLRVYKILSLIGVFMSVYCFFASKELILVVYGNQWTQAVLCFQAMSVSVWFQITASSCGSIYQSIGNTRLMFKSSLIFVPIQIAAIIIGVTSKNIVTLSWFVSISFIIKFFIDYFFLIKKGFGVSLVSFYKKIAPEIIITVLMITSMLFLKNLRINNLILSGLIKLIVCSITYTIGLLLTHQMHYLKDLLPRKKEKYNSQNS